MYFVRRLILLVPLLLVISFMAFVLVRVAPGGPFDKERAAPSPEIKKAMEAKYRLNEPLLVQYWIYLKGLLRGDLGPSLKYRNHSVNDIIVQGLPVSLALGATAFLFALGIGIPLGFFTAVFKRHLAGFSGGYFVLPFFCSHWGV